jgi:hypothetical protein
MSETKQEREARLLDELYHRKRAGANGQLWCIEVLYDHEGEVKRYQLPNQYSKELLKFRETIIQAGLMLPTRAEKGQYIIVLPWNIVSINVTRQDRFFEPK